MNNKMVKQNSKIKQKQNKNHWINLLTYWVDLEETGEVDSVIKVRGQI